jgi:hypothetical protein
MKKIAGFLFICLLSISGFAEDIVLDNKTPYPGKKHKTKMAIQWANSAKAVEQENHALTYQQRLSLDTLQTITQAGKITLQIPDQAEHFRILVWTDETETTPDLVTNWVDVIPNKTYTLQKAHLIPSVLMLGSGC